ncbi:MAG TPA: fibronectin type III domain-containing protein [Nitrosopumilaceae archaeon]|nr:fibronectin type III domain-containing protein [Nitrosopumilaceae archaeon]
MYVLNSGTSRWLILVFALVSIGMIVHNAFADTYVDTIQVGSNPYGVDVNSNTNKIYVANYGSGTVSVINGSTDKVVNTIGASNPFRLAVNPITNQIYLTDSSGLVVIDGATNSVVSTIPLGGQPWGVAVNTNTNKIYVTNRGSNSVFVIDGSTNKVTNTISLGNYLPMYLAVNPSTNKIYVSAGLQVCNPGPSECATHTVFVINGSSNSVANTIAVGYFPDGIAIIPNTNKIYVANYYDSDVSVIDGRSDTVVGSIPVGQNPEDMAANPSTNKIYVANLGNNNVSIINGTSNTVLKTIPVGSFPEGIGVNTNTNKIYVANGNSGTVSVIDGSSSSTSYVLADQASCNAAPFSGTWNSVTSTCTTSGFGTQGWGNIIIINPGIVLNNTGTIYTVGSTLTNDGTIINNRGSEINNSGGTIDNNGGIINNGGSIWTKGGFITNSGTINNNSGGTIDGDATINNTGIINNYASIRNQNPGPGGGTINNNGGTINNKGGATILDAESTINNNSGGSINNDGTITNYVYGTINNSGTINNNSGGTINNQNSNYCNICGISTINNNSGGSINNDGIINNYSDAYINNNSGAYINNNGTISDYCGSKFNNSGTLTGNPVQNLCTAPAAPTGLTAKAISSSQITISWTAPSNNGGSAITGYMIERSNNTGTTWSTIVSNTGSTATTYNDTGLAPNTTYTYRVSAINSVGTSSPSNTSSATTASTQLSLIVKSVDLSGNPITGMSTVIRYTNGTTISDTFTPAFFTVKSGTTYVVHVRNYGTNVFNHWNDGTTNSYYTITPTQNTTLTAYYSTGTTTTTAPSAPQNLQATSGNSQVTLSWNIPSSNGGSAITNYKIYRSTSSGTETFLATTGNVLSYTDGTVTNGQTYFYKVTAVNSVGESSPSNEASATPSGGAGVTVQSIAQNNNPIYGIYTLLCSQGTSTNADGSNSCETGSSRLGSGNTTVTFSGLPAGQTFGVDVYNNATCSFNHWSDNTANTFKFRLFTATNPPQVLTAVYSCSTTAPQPPTSLAATAVSSSQINLSWTAPSNNGGSAITGYKIERSNNTGTTWSTIQSNTANTSTTYSDTGLTASTTYTYRVSAINSVGTSSPSNTSSATTSSAPPTTTQVTITVKSVNLSGNPITGMSTVIRYTNGTTISEGFTPVSFTVTSGTTYVVHVRDYMTTVFNHWQDGSTNSYYTITPTQNVVLTAYYSTP